VMQELRLHGQGIELALPDLPESGVAAYLRQRLATKAWPAGLARVSPQRTAGNP
jgi:hypothetical protein